MWNIQKYPTFQQEWAMLISPAVRLKGGGHSRPGVVASTKISGDGCIKVYLKLSQKYIEIHEVLKFHKFNQCHNPIEFYQSHIEIPLEIPWMS